MFRLHEDLSVALLHELPTELGIADSENYDPLRLIDTSAPSPPPRALTMLGEAQPTFRMSRPVDWLMSLPSVHINMA